jgi:hypothetical protein
MGGAGRPDTDRAAAAALIGIGVIEQCQRIRNENGRAQSLHPARCNQHGRIGCERTGERSGGENRKAGHEDPFGADAIAKRAGGQDERGKRNGIGVDDPLQLRHAAAERGPDAIERRVDDGDVELDHAVAKAHGKQRQRCRDALRGLLFRM